MKSFNQTESADFNLFLFHSGGSYLRNLLILTVAAIKSRPVGWLVGFYGTAAQYRLYSAGECSECENECAYRVGVIVPPCTLEQWVNSPPPSHWG